MSTLELIFNLVEKKAHELRKKNAKADGQKFWQPIKNILKKYDVKVNKWKKISNTNKKIMLMPEYYIDGHDEKHIIEKNHFLIQTIRIPLTEEPNLRKIIQLALNIGQWTGSGGKKENWMKLHSYLAENDIIYLNSKIPKKLYDEIKQVMK